MGCLDDLKNVRKEITSSVFFPVSVPLIRATSLDEAVTFCELLQTALKFATFFRIKDGWFYAIESTMTDCTGLTKYEYRETVKKLIAKGLIETKFAGMPRRKYFKISATADVIKDITSRTEEKASGACDGKDGSYIEMLRARYPSYASLGDETLLFIDKVANNTENPYASLPKNVKHNKK